MNDGKEEPHDLDGAATESQEVGLVHVPKSYDGSKPTPVVLLFHGGGSNLMHMIQKG